MIGVFPNLIFYIFTFSEGWFLLVLYSSQVPDEHSASKIGSKCPPLHKSVLHGYMVPTMAAAAANAWVVLGELTSCRNKLNEAREESHDKLTDEQPSNLLQFESSIRPPWVVKNHKNMR